MASTAFRSSQQERPNVFTNLQNMFQTLDNKLGKSTVDHLRNVYGTLALGVGIASVGCAAHLYTSFFRPGLFVLLGSLISVVLLSTTPHSPETIRRRLGYFAAFAACSGISVGPLVEHTLDMNPSVVMTALLASLAVFASFSLSALFAERTKFLFLGGILSSVCFGLFFFSWAVSYSTLAYLVLFMSCGFILYDTQLIVLKERAGDNDYVWHAVELFIDLVDVFRALLVILRDKDENDRRKRR